MLNIERVVGSQFNDTLTGDAAANTFEGGLGNDLIYGGDGGDTIYGGLYSQIGPFTLDGATSGPQADMLYGGNGGISSSVLPMIMALSLLARPATMTSPFPAVLPTAVTATTYCSGKVMTSYCSAVRATTN